MGLGKDAAMKTLICARVLMKRKGVLKKVDTFDNVTLGEIASLKEQGKRIKFICSGEVINDKLELRVEKTIIDSSHPFYHVNKLNNVWHFEFENLCPLTLIQHDGSTRDTGYGLHADLLD